MCEGGFHAGAAAEEGQAAGNTEAGVEDQDPAAPAGAEEQVEPGSTVADERLASVKLTSGILETLLSTCVRVAIWTDRHGARAKSPAGQGWRSGDSSTLRACGAAPCTSSKLSMSCCPPHT